MKIPGICSNNNKLDNFMKSLYQDENNSNAIWNNTLDGHYNCFGSSPTESIHLFEQCKILLNKHDLEQAVIILRMKTLLRCWISLSIRFGYSMFFFFLL